MPWKPLLKSGEGKRTRRAATLVCSVPDISLLFTVANSCQASKVQSDSKHYQQTPAWKRKLLSPTLYAHIVWQHASCRWWTETPVVRLSVCTK